MADEVAYKSFCGASGGEEYFLVVTAPAGLEFGRQLKHVERRYGDLLRHLGLSGETAICRRLFVSDVMNQAALVRNSPLFRDEPDNPVAVSLIEQPPLPGAKIAMLAYHAGVPPKKRRLSAHDVIVETSGQRHLWTTGLCSGQDTPDPSPAVQTRAVFGELIDTLARQGATLRDHCVRTWIYLKDVDTFYAGMVESRGAVFAQHGLSGNTHFIASTGIEGACAHRHDLIAMDAYSNLDLEPRQLSYLNDFERLCPTRDYNVHFERGTRVSYADRAHYFISGTASIDNRGRVVHEGDVVRQFEHALNNVEALLHSGNAELSDLMHLIVYLRDPSDFARIDALRRDLLPDVPTLIVEGAVCRPEWLVEIEGVGIAPRDAPALPVF